MRQKSKQPKPNLRKVDRLLAKADKIAEQSAGVTLDTNPELAKAELAAMGINARIKHEGLNG